MKLSNNPIQKFIQISILSLTITSCSFSKSKIYNKGKESKIIYLDNMATTPVDKRVLKVVKKTTKQDYGNAHSLHDLGLQSKETVENARKDVANLINGKSNDIIFTSGATESNNIFIQGFMPSDAKQKIRIITTSIEHKCILQSITKRAHDAEIVIIAPEKTGIVNLDYLESILKNNPENKLQLVSIIALNNEIGVIQDIEKIGKLVKKYQGIFHTDAAQACGKIEIDVEKMNIDMLSISGHKIYGPKGIGALYIKNIQNMIHRNSKFFIEPIIVGGGQEKDIRSGTLAVPLIAGLGKASEIAKNDIVKNNEKIDKLSDRLKSAIMSQIPDAVLNGNTEQKHKSCLNFSFPRVDSVQLVKELGNKVAISAGAACGSSRGVQSSYVVEQLSFGNLSANAVRLSIGKFNTEKEIDKAAELIVDAVNKIKIKK